MLAARICREFKILDVEEFVAVCPSRVLDFWEAYDRVEPFSQTWLQTAVIATGIDELHSFIAASKGQERKPRGWEAFMPPRFKPKTEVDGPSAKTSRRQTVEEFSNSLDALFS